MFKVHKKIKYALTALKYMKTKPRRQLVTAKEICAQFHMPFDPTSRVLQIMAQQGVLQAEQGARGGYRLVGDLSRVTLFDLSFMITGPLAITDCTGDEAACKRSSRCVLKNAMNQLNTRLTRVFKDVKVNEMI